MGENQLLSRSSSCIEVPSDLNTCSINMFLYISPIFIYNFYNVIKAGNMEFLTVENNIKKFWEDLVYFQH